MPPPVSWPAPASAYSTGGGDRPPNHAGVNWLWALIIVLVAVAVVRFGSWASPPKAPATVPYTPASPVPLPSADPGVTPASDAFCAAYFIFSIDVATSWADFEKAVSRGDTATASDLVTQFHTEAQAMQHSDPPPDVGPSINAVVINLQASQDARSTGQAAGVPAPADTWSDIQSLQAVVDPVCS